MCEQPAARGPGSGRVVERMGRRPLKHPISTRCSGRTGRRASPTTEVEVGVRVPHRCLVQRTTHHRVRASLCRQRQRIRLLPRCRHRLRVLVLRKRIDRSKCAHDRPRSRPRLGTIRRVLRRWEGKRLRARRADRPAAVETKADPHFIARITAGAKFYNGRLFVPVSSSEEFSSGTPDYPCCTSRGSVVALDANTGKQIWKAWVVPEEPQPYTTQSNGVTLYKPAGGAVWNTPTVDPVRGAMYLATGDATTVRCTCHRRRAWNT